MAALQLSTLCDQLGLSAAAADWQHLAAPESWPSAKQQQQAARSQAVQLLARDLLQGHAAGSVGRPATAGSCEQPSQPPPPPQQQQQQQKLQGETPGFLVEVLAGVDKHTLASWLPNTSSSGPDGSTLDRAASHGTWGSRVGSAQGGPRPSSAAGAGAAAAALAAGVGGSGTGSIRILQVSPVNALDGWVCIARYLVDHAQYTAGQKLCSFALEQARCACGTCNPTLLGVAWGLLRLRTGLLRAGLVVGVPCCWCWCSSRGPGFWYRRQPGGSIRIRQVSPVNVLDGLMCTARYLVDHAQYTAGQKLCGFALEQARCASCLHRLHFWELEGGREAEDVSVDWALGGGGPMLLVLVQRLQPWVLVQAAARLAASECRSCL